MTSHVTTLHRHHYSLHTRSLCVILALAFFSILAEPLLASIGLSPEPSTAWAASKRKPIVRKDPELKIVDVNMTPVPYHPQQGPLEVAVTLDLPPAVEPTALLEVTALISSPSRSSLRFLSYRNTIGPLLSAIHKPAGRAPIVRASTAADKPPSPRIHITLTWDGKDHTQQDVPTGLYHYELRAKVIAGSDNTPRTLTVAWPKRGTLTVK